MVGNIETLTQLFEALGIAFEVYEGLAYAHVVIKASGYECDFTFDSAGEFVHVVIE